MNEVLDETHRFTDLEGIAGLLMLVRFGAPALIFGATRPGPLGNRWLTEGTTATLLLDADMRFFGAMMIGIGIVFFWTISKAEALAVEFEPKDGGTLLRFRHSGLPEDLEPMHGERWSFYLARLQTVAGAAGNRSGL